MTDQLMSEKCDTCIFRPGNPMRLQPGRLQDVIRANQEAQTLLTCHKTTYGQHPEIGESYCRGYYDSYGERALATRLARTMGLRFTEVDPPEEGA